MENSKIKQLEKAFMELQYGQQFKQVWSSTSLHKALKSIGALLALDISDCFNWFLERQSSFDPEDIIEPPMTYSQFQRRFGNYLLYKLFHESENYALPFDCFIRVMRKQFEELQLKQKNKNSLKQKVRGGFVKGFEKRFVKRFEIRARYCNKEISWMSLLIKFHEEEIRGEFLSFVVTNDETMDMRSSKHIFKKLIKICRLKIPENSLNDYYNSVNSNCKARMGKSKLRFPTVSFLEFLDSVDKWANCHKEDSKLFKNKLERTIIDFKMLKPIRPPFDKHLKSLNRSLEELSRRYIYKNEKEINVDTKRNIEKTFSFYARAIKGIERSSSFHEIEENSSSWTVSKFLKFCTDFKITERIPKDVLVQIFKKHATFTRYLSLSQFEDTLDTISEEFYGNKNQEESKHWDKSTLEKREMLYKFLKLNSDAYMKKLRGFGPSFGMESTSFRIPIDDSCHSYKFNISEQQTAELEEWREKKKAQSFLSNNRLKKRQCHRVALNRSHHYLGYSKRSKHQFTPDNKSQETKSSERFAVNFGNIDKLNFDEFTYDLVSDDEEDPVFNEIYADERKSSDGKFAHIIKIQDNLLAKGMKVARKNRVFSF